MTSKTLILSLAASMLIGFGACKKEKNDDGALLEEKKVEVNLGGTSDIEVKQKQIPILFKITGETCFYCGDWGWDAWINLSNKYKAGRGFSWANYGTGFSSGKFRGEELNPTMDIMENMFEEGSSKPNFAANGKDYSTSSANAEKAAEASILETAKVSAGMKATITGSTLTIKAAAKFFADMDGEYYMGAYLVENNVKGTQSGKSGVVDHHLVMRGSLSSSAWGVPLATDAKTNAFVEKTYTAEIPATYNKDNFTYGIIIWKKVGTKYSYVNAYSNQ